MAHIYDFECIKGELREGVKKGVVVFDSKAPSGVYTRRLLELLTEYINNVDKQTRLSHLVLSPETHSAPLPIDVQVTYLTLTQYTKIKEYLYETLEGCLAGGDTELIIAYGSTPFTEKSVIILGSY